MLNHDSKINNIFENWLKINLLLVFGIIMIGGLTRLTNSGLSITEWELFRGVLPPLNELDWNKYFLLYKQIPQYELINPGMSMEEFKIIYYWEYFHRIFARIIGIFFFSTACLFPF